MSLKWMLPTLLMTSLVSHAQTPVALKDVFKGYFHVGAAINQAQFEERDARGAAIVREQIRSSPPRCLCFRRAGSLRGVRREAPHVHHWPHAGVAQPGAAMGVPE